jgi:hypothetical protein
VANSAPGPLIGRGRNADVFGIGGGRVLRRYRDGRAPLAVAREAEVMTHARAHGVPVPEVFDVSGYDIVMEHAVGPTMLDVLGKRPWTFRAQARLLARVHGTVHAVPALDWLPALPARRQAAGPELARACRTVPAGRSQPAAVREDTARTSAARREIPWGWGDGRARSG